ncbi:Putative amidophosphoribosyltransferase [Gloeomargarita lithophora Alchichica-D10]|uniref:Amidophosphoribosyltransferase n=1 Tax=Gloeomargarita lithophora Alchichica-D10 TaxID=1188229 RepID=A0A1J0AE47_9CYAN|nr:Putative amidophosphoribosyltransferase [Gloeomargarita lithophora Alchichica-D10]
MRSLLATVFRPACPLCTRPAQGCFCIDCQRQILATRLPQPWQFWHGDLPIAAWGRYRDTLKRVLGALKYNNRPELARPLGHHLGELWLTGGHGLREMPLVVPIPVHPDKRLTRGYNQAELLAASFCEFIGLKLSSNLLLRQTNTQAQHHLSVQAREANLATAFVMNPQHPRPTAPVLIVDDIYTTGATARTAQTVLQQAGCAVVGILVVATGKADMPAKLKLPAR